MSVTLELRFPIGRFHATPWDRSANEGAPEWPPSPWRVLRALYATWLGRLPELPERTVHRLLGALAAPPVLVVPPHGTGGTRHYFPDSSSGPPKVERDKVTMRRTDKVLDAFVAVDRDASVAMHWDAHLDEEACAALGRLAAEVTYVGRAESLCDLTMSLEEPREPANGEGRWEPVADGEGDQRSLCPRLPFDIDLLAQRVVDVRREGRLLPRGAAWVGYDIDVATRPRVVQPRSAARGGPRPTALRFSIAAPALPGLQQALAQTGALRSRLLSAAKRELGHQPPVLLGKEHEDGPPLTGNRHAHYLALDLDGDRLLETYVVYARDGFDPGVVQVAAGVRSTYARRDLRDGRDVRLALDGLGPVERVAPELTGPSERWRTHTPFAPPRHRKPRDGEEASWVAREVRRELAARGLPEPEEVLRLDLSRPGTGPAPLSFRRRRAHQRLRDDRTAYALELRFAEPVSGPIAIGALSHFGLGLFLPHTSTIGADGGAAAGRHGDA